MLWQAVGVGLAIGVVHAACVFVVLAVARKNVRRREDESIGLMRERNELDKDKIAALQGICDRLSERRSVDSER